MTPQLIALAQKNGLPKGCQVFQVRYRYGDHIVQNGVFHLPNEQGELVPIHHPSIPAKLQEKLPDMPIWSALEKQVEIYLMSGERVVPIDVQNPGEFFLRESAPWNVCAGARTIFLTAKISEKRRHQHINKHYKLNTPAPTKLTDHFGIFKAISHSETLEDPWYCDVLIFSKEWFSNSAEIASMVLKTYFQQEQLKKQSLAQLNSLRDCAFSTIESTLNLRMNQNTVNYVRHILEMGKGNELGLSFDTSENFFPKATLEKAYLKHYKLAYAPIFMTLSRVSKQRYFSLNAAINNDLNTQIRNSTSRIEELRDVSRAINKMKDWIPRSSRGMTEGMVQGVTEGMSIGIAQRMKKNLAQQSTKTDVYSSSVLTPQSSSRGLTAGSSPKQFSFFHTHQDPSDDIQAIEQLTEQDIVLTKELERFPNQPFCIHSLLLKGLIGTVYSH